jgi:type II secretory pathway component PulF
MTDIPVDLDSHRGMAAQKATDLRRALADVEAQVRELREREAELENRMMSVPATSWPEAAVKARHLLNLYAAGLPTEDTRHRALVAALFDDFARLNGDG